MVEESQPQQAQRGAVKCPECGSTKIIYDATRGESVCGSCGSVLKESMIDLTQEWRAFDDDQRSRRVRTGAALTPTKHDQGITTEIGKGRGELFKVASKKRAQYYRLTKWHKRLIKSKDRNLSFAFSELQRLISFLHLSRAIHEKVAKLYQQAVNKGLVRGRSTESIIAALLYTTCREEGAPRTLDEISKASGINRREIGKTYRYIARKLRIRILPAKAQDYVPRFGSLLGLTEKVQVRAVEVLDDAGKQDVTSGKGPIGVAAASLYIAAVLEGEKKAQREVADAIGVTEVTIRNRYKEIVEALGIKDKVEELVKEEEEAELQKRADVERRTREETLRAQALSTRAAQKEAKRAGRMAKVRIAKKKKLKAKPKLTRKLKKKAPRKKARKVKVKKVKARPKIKKKITKSKPRKAAKRKIKAKGRKRKR
ncbi:MAG: transcription initiation factor IIB [Candidatus Aenigmarchaeota archaeon]|nr:transcription initiation factor IIB [Candidatus Aenigmarchaeota archaeon]